MGVEQAVQASREGTALAVEVVPGAKEARFPAGFNPWRGRLEARVEAPPEQGQANAELAGLVAGYFGLPPSAARVVAGHASRRKTVEIRGLRPEAALDRLARDLKV